MTVQIDSRNHFDSDRDRGDSFGQAGSRLVTFQFPYLSIVIDLHSLEISLIKRIGNDAYNYFEFTIYAMEALSLFSTNTK